MAAAAFAGASRSAASARTATSTTTGSTAASRRRGTRPSSSAPGTAAAALRREPGARRPPPAGRRLPAARLRARSPRRRYPVLYLLHGVPGPAGRVPRRPSGWASSRTSSSRARRAQPLILVMPFGSTGSFTDEEWANGVRPRDGWETFVARDLVHAIDARYRTIRRGSGRALARALRGRLRRAQHRAPPPRRVPRARELVGLRARRRHRLDLRPPRRAACARTARSLTLRRGGARRSAARTRLRLVLQRHRRPLAPQNAAFAARARGGCASRTASSSSTAGTTGRSGAATPRARYLAASRRPRGA